MKRVLEVWCTCTSSGLRSIRWRQARFVPAGEDLRVCRLVEQNGVAALPVHDRHHDMACRALLERADQLGEVARRDQRLVGEHDEHRIEGPLSAASPTRTEPSCPWACASLCASVTV